MSRLGQFINDFLVASSLAPASKLMPTERQGMPLPKVLSDE